MDKAAIVVDALLETNEKWDNAWDSYRKLYGLKQKSMSLFQEMGRAIQYERALARAGVKKSDVHHPITAEAIGATHNYKGKRPMKICIAPNCTHKPLPPTVQQCPNCGGEMTDTMVPWAASDLRTKIPKHIVGVELNDGRYVWFDQPLSRTPWTEFDPPEEKPKVNPDDVEAHRRAGKWW